MKTKDYLLALTHSLAGFILSACAGSPPSHIGQFAPCPDSPNCVSTRASDAVHSIRPIRYDSTKNEARERLISILKSMDRAKIIVDKESYVHVEFVSRIFRFVDDAEFYLNEEDHIIHFRSASRMGYSDLGVNRKRMEQIRQLFVSQG